MTKTVRVEREDAVLWITLDRPNQANSINRHLAADLIEALTEASEDSTVHAIVISGAGKLFCAGADLKAIAEDRDAGHHNPAGDLCLVLGAVPIPVIAMINGAAVGGGCEIALCCDMRIMADTASFSLPEIRFGALPAAGGTQRMTRVVGQALASEYMMTGRKIDPAEALRVGLVNRVVPLTELRDITRALAVQVASHARYALITVKSLIAGAVEMPLDQGVTRETIMIDNMATPEEREAQKQVAAANSTTYSKLFNPPGSGAA